METEKMNTNRLTKAALVVAAALFMQMLDSTIVTTALPVIGRDLSVSQSTASLLISAYMLAAATFIPLSGWLARRLPRKRLFLWAVALFTLSSVLGGLVNNLPLLLGMRVLQGVAGALMVPVGRLIILENTESKDLLRMLSYLVWPALIAPAIAPLLGGYIISYLTWHWIFFLNLPIGLGIILFGHRVIQDFSKTEKVDFDLPGFILVGLSVLALLISSDLLGDGIEMLPWGSALLLVAIAVGYFAVRHLRRASEPLFSLAALKVPTFRVYQSGGSIFWMTIGALPYMMTLLLQVVFSWSAVTAGTYVIFIFLGNLAIKPFTTPIIERTGYRLAIVIGLVLATSSTVAFAFMTPETMKWWIATVAFVSGVGRSLCLTSYNTLSFADLDREEKNSANTFQSVVQMLAQGLGVGVAAMIVAILQQYFSTAAAYKGTFILLALISIYPLAEILTLPKDAGAQTLHHKGE
ncbi:MFS transporter [Eupransor demetentiae]|uniref:MFS family (AraJ) n=1 Tax=Eupransor demetentiae TaxID=3109584 RepID=A0ABM9N591_9LACO|nr:MFS family (AraJ) [Lactobacillaceae bacterium LMG 33000]